MKVRRIPRTIDRWQDEPGPDNFSEAVRQIIDVDAPGTEDRLPRQAGVQPQRPQSSPRRSSASSPGVLRRRCGFRGRAKRCSRQRWRWRPHTAFRSWAPNGPTSKPAVSCRILPGTMITITYMGWQDGRKMFQVTTP
jgi:hypothetical protein